MRSVVYEGNHTLALREWPIPQINDNEVLIKVFYTGICGTDILIWHDKHSRAKPPVVLGHEFSGVIEKTGDAVRDYRAGDRVIVEPLITCGQCPGCLEGNYNLCAKLNLIGIDSDGSMARYVKAPVHKLFRIPDSVSMFDAAFVEPLAVAVHMMRQVNNFQQGQTVLVIGAGPIGLIAGAVARQHGANVIVSEIAPFRVEKARELGFQVITPGDRSVGDQIRELTGGRGAHVAFEATGVPAALEDCVDAVGVKGQVVIVGLPKKLPVLDTNKVVAKEITIVGSRVYRATDFEEALRLIEHKHILPQDYVNKVITLEDAIDQGFEAIERGEPVMKIIIDQRDGDDTK